METTVKYTESRCSKSPYKDNRHAWEWSKYGTNLSLVCQQFCIQCLMHRFGKPKGTPGFTSKADDIDWKTEIHEDALLGKLP